ncbi:hypothetical protein IK146_02705 [Candidatus Saccharibacteria bacterium]|nr:hypothetical protein [Candidatus Saccharibacteria bacterium]
MPSSSSKEQKKKKAGKKSAKKTEEKECGPFKAAFLESYKNAREKMWKRKRARVRLHQSFKRSYREDYVRKLSVPGLLHHAADTFIAIFKNWKLFVPLIIFAVVFNVVLVGLMSEDTYVQFQQVLEETNAGIAGGEVGNFAKSGLLLISTVTTGGLTGGMGEAQTIFAVIIFLLIWLVTIYLLRFRLAGKKVKLRDGLYNAFSPLVSTFLVFLVGFIQALPIFLVIFLYSAAVQTDFLATPFYALVFFIFVAALIILSTYLLSSTIIALIAVTAPGLYPMTALKTASDLMAGRRIRFLIRVIFMLLVLAVIWVAIMLPLMTLDLWLKGMIDWLEGVPFVPVLLLIMTCFTFVYVAAYLYLYYRRILAYEDDK